MLDHDWQLRYKLKVGDVVVEAGAYIGDDVYSFSCAVGGSGRAVFFEPNHLFWPELYKLSAVHGRCGNVSVVKKALWDECGFVGFVGGMDSGGHTVSGDDMFKAEYIVSCTTLDDEIVIGLRLPRIDLLCLDVEGAEERVLEGGGWLMKVGGIKHIAMACYHKPTDKERLPVLLAALGFGDITFDDNVKFPCLYADYTG